MLLAIDVGNTLTVFGLFEGKELIATFKIKSLTSRSADEYDLIFKEFLKEKLPIGKTIDRAIISSVVPYLTNIYLKLIKGRLSLVAKTLGPGLKNGLKLKVDDPKEVGSDLIADCVGALLFYKPPLFIADLGTASKYIFIDKEGAFAGLSIAPGLTISLDALVNGTASLPEIPLEAPSNPMGKNTIQCMKSGIIFGTVYECEGFAKSFEQEAGYPLTKILTGGNSSFVKENLPSFHYEEWLLLLGLEDIDRRNR